MSTRFILVCTALTLIVASPSSLSAQRASQAAYSWHLPDATSSDAFAPAAADDTVAVVRPDVRPAPGGPAPQRFDDRTPTPYVLGGSVVGAFAGGLLGYAGCVAGDGDCSVWTRLAAGSALGAVLGAVFWLASVPQP